MFKRRVTRTESIAVGLAVGILCPLLLFVFFWWVAAALASYLSIPEIGVAIAAFTGLAVGIGLDMVHLRKWIPRFYSVNVKLMVLLYLFCSAIAVASCMGLPFGNVALGTLAGGYVGRRAYHAVQSRESFSKTAHRAGLFTALVTGAWALSMGLLALDEQIVIDLLQAVMGLAPVIIVGPVGVGLISLLCVLLMAVQYWCARTGALVTFRLGGTHGRPTGRQPATSPIQRNDIESPLLAAARNPPAG